MPPRACWACGQLHPRPNTVTVTLSRAQLSALLDACSEYGTGLADNHPPGHPEIVSLNAARRRLIAANATIANEEATSS